MTLAEGAGFVVADLALWGVFLWWCRWLIRKGRADYAVVVAEDDGQGAASVDGEDGEMGGRL
jgi:hypothetical protein